jgi:hypothetical protein
MSETYTTIIPNVKDEEGDDVSLKIVFEKTTNPKIIRAKAFDSKGRYFYESTLSKNFEYYVNQSEEGKLKVIYRDYGETKCIELQGDKWGEYDTLNEDKDSLYHLQSINNEIAEAKKNLKILKKKKIQCQKFYSNLNLM